MPSAPDSFLSVEESALGVDAEAGKSHATEGHVQMIHLIT